MSVEADRLAELVRDEGRRVLATLVRTIGNLSVAEDAVADAVLAALQRWPTDGVPANPRAWLTTVARNRAVDIARREARRAGKEAATVSLDLHGDASDDHRDEHAVTDDLLRLVFTCCHPALSVEAQVALSLRVLCGLSTADVARLLLVSEPTARKRLTRAKQKITTARIPYRVPDTTELPSRLDAVSAVVHLMFTAGHSGGDTVIQPQLCDEAIRLGRLLVELMPDESGLQGLLALLLLVDARRATRADQDGIPLTLAEQDRTRWNRGPIDEGSALVVRALRRSRLRAGRFELQAAIAACHATAASYADTDWTDIVRLYDALLRVEDTPVVRLNRAVAIGERDGPAAGLRELEGVADLGHHHLWHACRAATLQRLGRTAEAIEAYDQALRHTPSPPERHLLTRRRDALRNGR